MSNNSKRKLPTTLAERQEQARSETREKVQQAIISLKEEGRTVNIKNLLELTGLARATFSKPHVDEILKINKVCKYEVKNSVSVKDTKTFHELKVDIQVLEKKIDRLLKKNTELINQNNSLKLQLFEQKDKNEKLLGEIQTISMKCRMNNIRLETIEIDNTTMLEIIK
ncbi:MAG: hypothetical protein IJ086_00220 [Clostridium sp.]|nr:hypothetical protein [Clostridium sp.]